jgi:3-hydroxyacyl-CoA dehydrogenase
MINNTKSFHWPLGLAVASVASAVVMKYAYTVLQKKRHYKYLQDLPKPPTDIPQKTVLVVGGGTIGMGFASVFLAKGMTVLCVDPNASQEALEKHIRGYWPFMVTRGLTSSKEPPFGSFEKLPSVQQAAQRKIDFVQECVFEDVDIKQTVLAELDACIDPSVLIASSTSFIPWTLLFTQCQHHHRLMIGHPSIPHIDCFMEIYGISADWAAYCKKWYLQAGMDAIVMKKTIPGHVFNSLLRVNLDHASYLTRQDICTPQDINVAMRHFGRMIHGQHMYLALFTVIGGDRGFEGGKAFAARVQKDAIYLVLFSAMKKSGYPDIMARPISKYLGRLVAKFIPAIPEDFLDVAKCFDEKLTRHGTMPTLDAVHEHSVPMYQRMPMEVGNDPFQIDY